MSARAPAIDVTVSVRWKKCLDLLTPDKRAALQERWDHHAADLLARDGDDPEHPNQFIKNNPQLRATLQHVFENFICLFLERALADGQKSLPPKFHTFLSSGRTEWAVNRYSGLALRSVDRHVQNLPVSIDILGGVIRRSIDSFKNVFPEFDEPSVNNDSVRKFIKYSRPPKEFVR